MAGLKSNLLFRLRRTFREDHAPLSPALEVPGDEPAGRRWVRARAVTGLWEQARLNIRIGRDSAPDLDESVAAIGTPGLASSIEVCDGSRVQADDDVGVECP